MQTIASLLSILGLWLNTRQNILCWPIWCVSDIAWCIYCVQTNQWPSFWMWIVYFVFNVIGWVAWHKKRVDSQTERGIRA